MEDEAQPAQRRPRVVSWGIVTTGVGALLLAATYGLSSGAVAIFGTVLDSLGLVLVGIGGGLKTMWEVAKAMFP
jgi:hypothetical protein